MKIAVIGLGCRFAGSSNSPSQFFTNLLNGKDCIEDTPKNRWNLDFYQDDDKNRLGKLVPKKGGFMDAIYDFDNEAFNMSAKEAMNIDAQQRILLEVAHQALLDAKIDYRGTRTGVFVGVGSSDFTEIAASNPYYANEYTATGGSMAVVSNRLSFSFDLHGPSISIDTACSSSGSALLVAVRCLEKGDCENALVAGINVLQNQSMTIGFTKLGVLSPDCKCKSFDESADGYVRSEGCGVIVLKPLDKAIRDGNHVYMTIDAVKCNEDGAQSPSLTMPSTEAQEQLIRETLADAKVNPEDIFFVEAHATGTPVGDPVEANAIGRVVGVGRTEPVRLGSVKPNIGHAEFASCLASLVKCAMMMDSSELAPNIHFKQPNPKILFDNYKMVVQTKSEKFDRNGKLMMVSSFGFGGANCCIIVGPPPVQAELPSANQLPRLASPPYLFMASGLSKAGLTQRIEDLKQLEGDQHDLMYSLNATNHTCSKLLSYGLGETLKDAKFVEPIKIANKKSPVVFVFSGQGPQNSEMGRQLYKSFPKFKEVIDECDRLYVEHGGVSVINDMCLFGDKVGDKNSVHKIEVTLPGLIFMQIGLFELWKSFGVTPDAIIGHSFGEMCAIYATNAVSLKDIICVTIARSKLMQQLGPRGTMIALGCSKDVALEMIKEGNLDQIWIAAINSPEAITLGGIVESVQKIGAMCTKKGIFNRQLNVTNAFHTPLLAPLKEKAEEMFKDITAESRRPEIMLISTVTGQVWDRPFNYTYFWENIENKVLFLDAVNEATKIFGTETLFVEMAPHPVLSISLKQIGVKNMIYSQHREEKQQGSLLQACAKMAANGISLDWANIIGKPAQIVQLPQYPYQRKKYFFENEFHKELRLPSQFGTMLGMKIVHHANTFQNFISTKTYSWLQDHVVQKSIIFPAAGYVELVLESVGNKACNIIIKNPLLVPEDGLTFLQTSIKSGNFAEIFSKREGDQHWTMNATGCKKETVAASTANTVNSPQETIAAIQERCNNVLVHEDVYKRFNVMNLDYGYNFQLIETLYQGDEESLGALDTSRLKDKHKYIIHPAILDCCFQSFIGALQSSAHTFLPTTIQSIEVVGNTAEDKLFAYCSLKSLTEKDITGDITVYGANGDAVILVKDFVCTKVANQKYPVQHYYSTVWQTKAFPEQKLVQSVPLETEQQQWREVAAMKDIYYQAIAYYISKLPSSIFENNDFPIYTKRHLAWCKSFAESQKIDPESLTRLASIPHFQYEAQCITRAGEHLEELIINKDNAVSRIMFSDDLIASLYQSGITSKATADIFVELFSKLKFEEHRVIRILEVGAGTGTLAKKMLPLLQQFNNRVEYFFTDVSAAFFASDKRMKEYTFVQYKVVDIGKPLAPQGIEECSIDLIIGFDVVHAAANLSVSMNNLSKALVPNGLLYIIEPTIVEPYMHFIFGVFREWWGFEDDRSICCLTNSQWKENMPKYGFKNFETFQLLPDHPHSILLAQKADTFNTFASPAPPIIYEDANLFSLLELAQTKIANKDNAPLIIVTKDAQIECLDPDQASVVGFARVIANEQPTWIVRSVDFSSSIKADDKQKWLQTISDNLMSFESEIAIRDDQVYVPRLQHIPIDPNPKSKKELNIPFRLEASDGLLDNLKYHYVNYTLPEKKILVRTKAASLNFKDVLLAMRMLNVPKTELGIEFSGIVEKVGKSSKFKVGDEVYGISENCLASHVIASEHLVVKKPANVSFEQAASIPIVFLTTYWALIYKANIQPGQLALVHSAAGGVGQAAIQLLQWKKAHVVATVGSDKKRTLLQEKYGVTKFADSHSPTWDVDVMNQNPEGVDLVLNSLNGAHIDKGLRCLRSGGSFVEIGKRDILDNSPMGLHPFLNNLTYFSVQLDMLMGTHEEQLGLMLQEVSKLFEQNILTSFVDTVYPASKIVEAFKYMQSGKHMGKIVIRYSPEDYPVEILPPVQLFSKDKTYVLSGGMGALGFELAKWMVAQGARYLILFSRSASKLKKEHTRGLEQMKKQGACVHISNTNVSNAAEVEQCFAGVQGLGFPSIAGIMHLAMVLDDDSIPRQTAARFTRVLEPKVQGAKNMVQSLLKTTKPQDVEFVLFVSSISSVIGNPEQSNYVSANSFLDAYAEHLLRHVNVNAKVINLGAINDYGICATDFKLRKIMAARGLENSITVAQIADIIKSSVLSDPPVQYITPFNVKSLYDFNPALRPKIAFLIKHQTEDSLEMDPNENTAQNIAKQIEKILQLESGAIDPNEKLTSYGVDSLLAVEISSMLGKRFGLKVSQMDILSGLTVARLQDMMAQ